MRVPASTHPLLYMTQEDTENNKQCHNYAHVTLGVHDDIRKDTGFYPESKNGL